MNKKTDINKMGMTLVFVTFLFIFFILIINSGVISAVSSFSYSPSIQYQTPGSYESYSHINAQTYWPILGDRNSCEASTDFLMFIRPGSCNPLVVRSDLLEEQNVPIFCKVDIVKLNPLIDISEIKSVKFQGQFGKYVAGVTFHPNREAIYQQGEILNNPAINDVGYVVVLLKRIPSEKDMPAFVRVNLTGVLRYDIENFFGSGKSNYYLEEDKDWEQNYQDYSILKGRAYLRLDSIFEDSARVSIYSDKDTRMNTFELKKGESSGTYYLPGFYCKAKINIRLDDFVTGVNKVTLEVDDKRTQLVEGERFLDNKCVVSDIGSDSDNEKFVKISCRGHKTETLYENDADVSSSKDEVVDTTQNIDSLAKNIFNKAKEEAYSLYSLYGEAASNSGEIWSAKSLYELGILADQIKMSEEARVIFTKLLNEYSYSFYANSAREKIGNLGSPGVSKEGTYIKLVSINIPERGDVSAEFSVWKNNNPIKLDINQAGLNLETNQIQEKEIFADGRFKLLKIEQDKVRLQYTPSSGSRGSQSFELSLDDREDSFGNYKIRLNKINSKKVAKISVIPEMPNAYSKADFLFEVGIEKRAIELSPEKTKKMITSLDDKIKKLDELTMNLGNLVKTMKGVCFTTSAVLIAKNFFMGGIQGGAKARQEIMPIYYKKCQQESANDKSVFEKCLKDYNDNIERDIEVRKKYTGQVNNNLNVFQKDKQYQYDSGAVNREKVADAFRTAYLSAGLSYIYYSAGESGAKTTEQKTIDTDKLAKASLTDLRDLRYYSLVANDVSSSELAKENANTEIAKIDLRLSKKLQDVQNYNSIKEGNNFVWLNRVNARYFMAGEKEGLVNIVPLPATYKSQKEAKEQTGFYVVVYEEGYRQSGEVVEFWVQNLGGDGNIDLEGDPRDLITLSNYKRGERSVLGLTKDDSTKIVDDAISAIKIANKNYGKDKFSLLGHDVLINKAGASTEKRCQDFMSPNDCWIMFNSCDPVLCPSSRCDLGGRYKVPDVVQSGIIGSIALCLPNIKEGIAVPVCVSGVQAGFDAYLSILKSYRGCLQENLDTGRTVGICDEIHSIYLCEFFWRQAAPFLGAGLMSMIESASGQGMRGGGEYLSVQDAWQQASNSIDYMKNEYAVNAYKAFKARSYSDVGTGFCKAFVSAKYPNKGFFDNLLAPDSPVQFSAWFDEIPFTEATLPATSQYKVFYHIWAGRDQGSNYQVYLKTPTSSAYVRVQDTVMVDTGFLPREGYVSETRDFTAPAGYKELCIRINGQDNCGFKKVSTSFALDYISDKYYEDELKKNVRTQSECISGSASAISLIQPNIQEGVQDMITPSLDKRGIVRVCSTSSPGQGADLERWKDVGYCDDESLRCWIDTKSIKEVVKDKQLEQELIQSGVSSIDKEAITDVSYANDVFNSARAWIKEFEENSKNRAIEDIFNRAQKADTGFEVGLIIKKLNEIENSEVPNKIKAEAVYLRFKIYFVLGKARADEVTEVMPSEVSATQELAEKTTTEEEKMLKEFEEEVKAIEETEAQKSGKTKESDITQVVHELITTSTFYVGEVEGGQQTNIESAFDNFRTTQKGTKWLTAYGGIDKPDKKYRMEDKDYYCPNFVPELNPFYVALPCNPYPNNKYSFGAESWVKITNEENGKIVYAQWMDVGPWVKLIGQDCDYVFGDGTISPKAEGDSRTNSAGIDLSPAVSFFLTGEGSDLIEVSWKFVGESEVPKDNTDLLATPWSNWEKICKLR